MHISEINIYPIKSLKGISVDSALVEERGLRHDRRWMLTTSDGMFFTQREFPKMALISTWIEADGLGAAAESFGDVFIPLEPDTGNKQQVTIWNSVCEGEVYDGALNEWFSDVIGTACQLIHMPDETRRSVNPIFDRGGEIVSFADGYPLMVIGEASLGDLNGRLGKAEGEEEEAGRMPAFLPMNRFRPNLVVGGSDAFAEDDWQRVRIGESMFRSTKPCERCVITTIDQAKGEFSGKEPLKTLASYRMAKNVIPGRYESYGMGANSVLFGQNLIVESVGGTLRVGDAIEVIDYI